MGPTKPWYRKARWWALIVVVVLVVGVRLAIDPIAGHYTRRALGRMKGFHGSFYSVHVSPLRLAYNITQLKIVEAPASDKKRPVAYAESIDAHLRWRDLLRFHLAAQVKITRAKASVIMKPWQSQEEKLLAKAKKKAVKERVAVRLDELLENLIPFRIARLEIRDGQALLIDQRERGAPELWLHDLQITVENLATREKLARGMPTVVGLRGILQRSGRVELFLTADPLAEKLTFAGELRVERLDLRELYQWVVAESGLKIPEGKLDLFASFRCDEGELTGGVKPMLRDVKVRAEDRDLGTKLKSALADTALDIFSSRASGEKTTASLIPIRGRITDPQAQLWPTVLAIVRNAFVVGLGSGMSNLPIETAPKQEGALHQARRALSKQKKPGVRAQPTKEK